MNPTTKSLLAAVSLAAACGAASAQELDKRWYLSGGLSYTFRDSDREMFGHGVDVGLLVEEAARVFVGV